jgi:type IV pilus assembly protein PilV
VPVRQQAGFTLLEVLIAITVLAIGLLGLAGLQLITLQTGQVSYQRSQAITLAYEVADRMRANRLQAGAKAYAVTALTTPTAATTNCGTASCSAAQLATYDVSTWYARVQNLLPSGTASIACSTAGCGTGVMQTVTVMWDESQTGSVTDTSCPGPTTFDPKVNYSCYSISFSP